MKSCSTSCTPHPTNYSSMHSTSKWCKISSIHCSLSENSAADPPDFVLMLMQHVPATQGSVPKLPPLFQEGLLLPLKSLNHGQKLTIQLVIGTIDNRNETICSGNFHFRARIGSCRSPNAGRMEHCHMFVPS